MVPVSLGGILGCWSFGGFDFGVVAPRAFRAKVDFEVRGASFVWLVFTVSLV